MRILVLGGTGFVGRHIVDAARERAHEVTVFNRGRRPTPWDDVASLVGDRDAGAIAALGTGEWDACVDVNAYVPQAVEVTARVLAGRVGRYCLISTGSVYRLDAVDDGGWVDEASPLVDPPPAVHAERTPELYGPLKVACERVAEEVFGAGALILRPGIVAGPYDPTNRFGWWVARLARGGETLAPGPPEGPVMVIDGRDLGAFAVEAIERGLHGPFNACGDRCSFAALLGAIGDGTASSSTLRWVDEDVLLAAGAEPFLELPLWLPGSREHRAFYSLANARARTHGLRLRPLAETAADTLTWLRRVDAGAEPAPVPTGFVAAGLTAEREAELLGRAAPPADRRSAP